MSATSVTMNMATSSRLMRGAQKVCGHFQVVEGGERKMLFRDHHASGDAQHAWTVEGPDIPRSFSADKDLDDAMAMDRKAIEGHLDSG